MSSIYRKASLDRLSSPDQLDRMVVITPPSFWIALTGAVLIIIVALIWSVVGRLPQKVSSQGIYLQNGGVYSVYADTTGVITSLAVQEGDDVAEGQVIATVSDKNIQSEIEPLQQRLDALRAITLTSQDDAVTADTKELIDLKTQLQHTNTTAQQTTFAVDAQEKIYQQQKAAADKYAAALSTAKKAYEDSLNGSQASATEQVAYSEAQAEASAKSSYYENGLLTYLSVLSSYYTMMESASAVPEAAAAATLLRTALDSGTPEQVAAADIAAADPAATGALGQALAAADPALAAKAEQYWAQLLSARDSVASTKKAFSEADARLKTAKQAYEAAQQKQGALTVTQQTLSNAYSAALNDYNTAAAALSATEQSLASLKAQLNGNKTESSAQNHIYQTQFYTAKLAAISQVQTQLNNYLQQQQNTQLVSRQAGRVSDVLVTTGTVVGQGSELVKINRKQGSAQSVVCYVPLADGKKVVDGMQVMVYPSTVNKQEYGHMVGEVLSVDNYISSTASLRTTLGDDTLVNMFTQNGPVVAVTCKLKEDTQTASGYYWSSKKGVDVTLNEGTLLSCDIVTSEKAPITLVIPLLKSWLTIERKAEA